MLRGCVSSREGTSIWLYVVNIFLDTAAYIVHRYVFRKLTLSLAGTWGTSLNMNVKQKRVPLSFSRWFGGNSACLKPAFCFLARWCNRNMETFCWVPKFLGTIFSKTPIFLRADCFQQILLMVQNSPTTSWYGSWNLPLFIGFGLGYIHPKRQAVFLPDLWTINKIGPLLDAPCPGSPSLLKRRPAFGSSQAVGTRWRRKCLPTLGWGLRLGTPWKNPLIFGHFCKDVLVELWPFGWVFWTYTLVFFTWLKQQAFENLGKFETTSIFQEVCPPKYCWFTWTSTVWKGINIFRACMFWISMLIFGGVQFVLDDPNSGWNKYQLFQMYSSRSFRRTWNYPNNSGQKMEWWELS